MAYRSYDYERQPDPAGELEQTLAGVLAAPGRIAVEAGSLPLALAEALRARGFELVPRSTSSCSRRGASRGLTRSRRSGVPRGSPTSSSRRSRTRPRPGVSEAELAAHGAGGDGARGRPPRAGDPDGHDRRGHRHRRREATERCVEPGDLVSDGHLAVDRRARGRTAANAVCAGTPTARHGGSSTDVRRALELAIRLCRPGAVPCEVDRRVREALADHGPTYRAPHRARHRRCLVRAAAHHAVRAMPARGGHGARGRAGVLRARASAASASSTSSSCGPGGNEILTRFEHTL